MVMVLYRSNALSSGLQAEDPTCATSSEVTFRRASLVTPVFSNSLATFSKFRCNKRKSILYKQFHNTAASAHLVPCCALPPLAQLMSSMSTLVLGLFFPQLQLLCFSEAFSCHCLREPAEKPIFGRRRGRAG